MYRIDRHDVRSDIPVAVTLDEHLAFCQNNVVRLNERDGSMDYVTGKYHTIHLPKPPSSRIREGLAQFLGRKTPEAARLHTNAAGDFTLMSKENWFALRGYPEFPMYCMHTDALLCQSAHYNGVKEEVLRDPLRIYHIEHGSGSGDGAGASEKTERLRASNTVDAEKPIPSIQEDQFHEWVRIMREQRAPIIFNNENWGLSSDDLAEETITE